MHSVAVTPRPPHPRGLEMWAVKWAREQSMSIGRNNQLFPSWIVRHNERQPMLHLGRLTTSQQKD